MAEIKNIINYDGEISCSINKGHRKFSDIINAIQYIMSQKAQDTFVILRISEFGSQTSGLTLVTNSEYELLDFLLSVGKEKYVDAAIKLVGHIDKIVTTPNSNEMSLCGISYINDFSSSFTLLT